jgi:multidrug efflux pump subunit AcrA (membrane-fusion protein)
MVRRESASPDKSAADGADDHAHEGEHAHDAHDDASSVHLSATARKNIGLTTGVVKPQDYTRSVTAPAIVAERPGRSQIQITGHMTGIVTKVYRIEGEAVAPGERLFDIRLTHEDLVTAQRDFLRYTEELDVVNREIARLEAIGTGVIAGKRILEQKYERQKLEAALGAQRQALLLHELTEAQLDEIVATRKLIQSMTITAPPLSEAEQQQPSADDDFYHVQQILVRRGQHVAAGDALAVLADHNVLYVEGQAFEDDAQRLVQASREGWPVAVAPVADGGSPGKEEKLQVLYVADHIEPESRALRFYLNLPNTLIRDESQGTHRFVAWKYRPGERMEVRIPTGEALRNQIVLPTAAVVEDGAEAFIFEQNGDHFDRTPVHVIHRDKNFVVLENDGALIGSTLALTGAYQLNLEMKKNAGGGVDPHAGHTH